tara:strand:- start:4 stop:435 length:432 start_codon:yes stop_codon:yes gene_type:complete
MVQNNEIQGEVEAQDIVAEVDTSRLPHGYVPITETKKGRGRPSGSTNKANDEVAALRKEIEILKNQIATLDSGASTSQVQVDHSADEFLTKLDLRVSILQQWVEMFHMFLTTSRITNSADKMAEDELTVVISKLPEQNHPLFI